MKVSIIIPIYNAAKYLVRCLDSVMCQTYQDIECILVEDCGTDNSLEIAKNYIKEHQGRLEFKLICHERNRGAAASRNTGMYAATGDYIFFLDSDDTIVNDCIETLLFLFHKYPNVDFAQGNALAENGEISPYGYSQLMPDYSSDKEELYKILLSEITTAPWNRLVKKSFIFDYHLFFPEGYFTEDMFWIYFIAKHVKAVAFTNKGLYTYYINEGSMMTSPQNHIKWFTSRLWTSKIYLSDIKHGISNKYQRQYLAINLLSCPSELKALKSLYQWLRFWKCVFSIAISSLRNITWYRIQLFFCLMPPICFLVSYQKYRWRIQQKIIPHV